MPGTISILIGALVLLWPAWVNRYPIVFADTQAFLVQGGTPFMIWDKPFVYGPFLMAFHDRLSFQIGLWFPVGLQALLLSAVLWLLQSAFGTAISVRHLAVCLLLALASAAPWFTSLAMPDIFAPIAVLCVWLLGFHDRMRRPVMICVMALGMLAVASHLSHLVLAAAVLAVVLMLRPHRLLAASVPLAGAITLLLVTNMIGFGRLGLSPHGSVFALARFADDALLDPTLARNCPQTGWRLCAWQGRLPRTSDQFLWDKDGPVWSIPGGPMALAPEAADIVAHILREAPRDVVRAVLGNTWRQLGRLQLGDTLTGEGVDQRGRAAVQRFLGDAELARLQAGRQYGGTLGDMASRLNRLHAVALLAGLAATLVLLWRGSPPMRALAASILLAVLANAVVTGGLSGPHDRYQARIAWLVLLPGLMNESFVSIFQKGKRFPF